MLVTIWDLKFPCPIDTLDRVSFLTYLEKFLVDLLPDNTRIVYGGFDGAANYYRVIMPGDAAVFYHNDLVDMFGSKNADIPWAADLPSKWVIPGVTSRPHTFGIKPYLKDKDNEG